MQIVNMENISTLLVRFAGVLVLIYTILSAIRSPALTERSVGNDTHLDTTFATFVIAGKTFVISAKSGKAIVLAFYAVQACIGLLIVYASRPLGRLLCAGLE